MEQIQPQDSDTWGEPEVQACQVVRSWVLHCKRVNCTNVLQVPTDRQQEVLMWQEFAACIRAIRAGAQPRREWPQQSLLTQRVLCAIAESAASDCRIVRL